MPGSRRPFRWLAGACFGLAVACGGSGPAGAIVIELDDAAPDRVERQRRAAEGRLPLPGTPDLARLPERLAAKGLTAGSEVFIRIFKAESELELWMRKEDRFELLDVYPICHWSGSLGPKVQEGDKQNPEGFYTIGRRHLHLAGRWPRSLNLGYPNGYDRSRGRTGSYILLHGGCSSVGCFAMTNAVMEEIFRLTEKALRAGQQQVAVHIFPFRMTDANLDRHSGSEWNEFWRDLEAGYDAFEATRIPPRIGVCGKRYAVEPVEPGEPSATEPAGGGRRAERVHSGQAFDCARVAGEPSPAGAGAGVAQPPGAGVLRRISHRPGEPGAADGAQSRGPAMQAAAPAE